MRFLEYTHQKLAKKQVKGIAKIDPMTNIQMIDSQFLSLGRISMRKVLALAVAGMVAFAGGSALADGDAKKGAKVFKKCKSCHTIKEGGKHKVGPNLFAVVGRTGGSAEGYKYSKGYMAAAEKLSWDDAALMEYLQDPSKYLSAQAGKKVKSKMTFKLKKEKDRKNVIAYLKTFQ